MFLLHVKLVRLLEIGLIINVEHFPAFRVAFEPESIKWDHDPQPFIQRAKEIAKGARIFTHSIIFVVCGVIFATDGIDVDRVRDGK